jgi:hypothetical protein
MSPTLTKRTAWSATFEHVLTDVFRSDCPKILPDVPPPHKDEMERVLNTSIEELPRANIRFICKINQRDSECGKHIITYSDYTDFIKREWNYMYNRIVNNVRIEDYDTNS